MQRPPADPKLTDAALALAARGWSVLPVIPGQKRPAIPGHSAGHCPVTGPCANGHLGWEQRATTDPDRIHRCWNFGGYVVGVATGPSGLVVVDLDTAKPDKTVPEEWRMPGVNSGGDVLAVVAERAGEPYADLFETYTVRTPSGGLHLYFRPPHGRTLRNSSGELGWLIDTRATGGHVVAAGGAYEVIHDTEPLDLPNWIVDRLGSHDVPTPDSDHALRIVRGGASRRTSYANSALKAEVSRVLAAGEGTRNDTLVRAAFALGQLVGDGILPEPIVTAALDAAGRAIGLPARECAATIRSGLQSGFSHPRGGAA